MADEMLEKIAHDVRQLGAALGRLEAVLTEPEASTKSWQDAADAFEYAMDLFWKVDKEILASRGVKARMPREAVQAAYDRGWIEDTALWIQMLKDEYEISGSNHSQITARQVYPRIRKYYPEMRRVHDRIADRLEEL